MIVAVVGDSERAAAVAALVQEAGHALASRREDADLWFVDAAPAALRAQVRAIQPGPATRVVLVSRGLEAPGGTRLSQVVTEESACLRVGALAGPILLGEVRRQSPTAAVVASAFHEVNQLASTALHSPYCRVYPNDDLAGVELAGALVEVVGAALGAARGLGMGVGLQAMVVTRGIAEGARLAARAGGDPRTFAGLAGAGELVACLGLPDHPGQHRGLALARGEADPELADLCGALLARCPDLPITQGVRAVAAGKARAQEVMGALITRTQREEHA